MSQPYALIVDLNNFARYPSLSVGYLTAILRRAGMRAGVFAPLMIGIGGVVREPRPAWYGLAVDRLNNRVATSRSKTLRGLRNRFSATRNFKLDDQAAEVAAAFRERVLADRPDAVLFSGYLMYRPHIEAMAAVCQELDLPAITGGPYFASPKVAEQWVDIPGQLGVVGGELELRAPDIVRTLSNGRDLSKYPGIWRREGTRLAGAVTPPLRELDQVPFADFTDFPWSAYPNKMVPILTGRGCGWGRCTFCSDVTSTAGRSYRSRKPDAVLDEVKHQYETHGTNLFVFVDLKLNSDLRVWRAILDRMQDAAPGARWIAAVHVNHPGANGLTRDELNRAAASGCVRLTTGLESGSQRVLDLMKKGADLAETERFLRDASDAGISLRTTMIQGYPGEQAQDVLDTDAFLRRHRDTIERVSLNRFQIMSATPIADELEAAPDRHPGLTQLTVEHRMAQVDHHYTPDDPRAYRRAVGRLLGAAHAINRKPLRDRARDFEGVM